MAVGAMGRDAKLGRTLGSTPESAESASRYPCHVTLRVREGVPSLRAPAFVRGV